MRYAVRALYVSRVSVALLVALLGTLPAQNLTLRGPATARPGTTITLTIGHDLSAAVTGFDWNLQMPIGWIGAATIAPALSASKQIACAGNRCLLFSSYATLNSDRIAPGDIAVVTVPIPSSAPIGQHVLNLTNVVAADDSPEPAALPITGGSMVVTILPSPYDVNGDGSIDIEDIRSAVNQSLGLAPCVSGDVNGDKRCDIRDIIKVAREVRASAAASVLQSQPLAVQVPSLRQIRERAIVAPRKR